MIVRDEEKSLPLCLNSVKDVADQIVIVDTGSLDKTIKIARSFGAEVYNYEWSDHFAKARNESIKYAKGEWILWMDADETLDQSSISELKQITGNNNKNYFYSIKISSKNEFENKVTYSDAHRLFPNGLDIQFENRIHEQIYNSAIDAGLKEVISEMHIIHEGYNLSAEEYRKKLIRNLPILEKMVKEKKDYAYAHYTLAQNYSGLKYHEKAIDHFKIAIKSGNLNRHLHVSALNVLAQTFSFLGNWEKAEQSSRRSIELEPIQSGGYYMLYKCSENKKDYRLSIEYLTKLLENTKRMNSSNEMVRNDKLISEQKILKTIANTYIKVGNYHKALESFIQLDGKEFSKSILGKIIEISSKLQEWNKLIQILIKYIDDNKEVDLDIYDILGQSYIKTNQLNKALNLYLKVDKNYGADITILKRISALYAKKGNREKAEKYILKLNSLL
tara:strand:- start:1822 stop:3159 length:1338 start_codon:yes stop_codon:yes gene_type:complete